MIKTEALLEKLFEKGKGILLVTDEKFNVRYISSSAGAIFGMEPYAILGRNAFDFVDEANRDSWRQCIEQSNGNKSSEIRLLTAAGEELYFDVTVTNHISNTEIHGLVIILYDITERKMKHRTLEQANNHLDQFIFKTFHDLRAPIHSALGLVDLTSRSSPEEKEKYVSLIKSNLQKMDAFIEEVSSYYKNEKMDVVKKKIDFNEVFEDEMNFIQNLPGAEAISFEYEFDGSCDLYSDPMRLKTILTNILSNSIKYSDPDKSDRFVKVSARVCESFCTVLIEDNGLGIAEDHLEKIFEIFFRSHPQIKGTGLGLYIVKDTVDRLGGEIEVNSKIGKGTTFKITVPNLIQQAASIN